LPGYNLGLYYKNSSDAPTPAIDAFRRVTEIDPSDTDTGTFSDQTYAQLKTIFPKPSPHLSHALKLDRITPSRASLD